MYVYIYIYIYIHTYTSMHLYMHLYIYYMKIYSFTYISAKSIFFSRISLGSVDSSNAMVIKCNSDQLLLEIVFKNL